MPIILRPSRSCTSFSSARQQTLTLNSGVISRAAQTKGRAQHKNSNAQRGRSLSRSSASDAVPVRPRLASLRGPAGHNDRARSMCLIRGGDVVLGESLN